MILSMTGFAATSPELPAASLVAEMLRTGLTAKG